VGAAKSSDNGKNWAFSSDAKPGIIYIPPTAKKVVPPPKSTAVPWEPLPPDARDLFSKALGGTRTKN